MKRCDDSGSAALKASQRMMENLRNENQGEKQKEKETRKPKCGILYRLVRGK